jgi:hypothetical protein
MVWRTELYPREFQFRRLELHMAIIAHIYLHTDMTR